MSPIVKPDGSATQLVELMQNTFSVPDGYSMLVLKWYDTAAMIRKHLENQSYDFLIAVKRKNSTFSREYNRVANTETVTFEIQIWAIETPETLEYNKAQIINSLHRQVMKWFQTNNLFGTIKASDNLDHTVKDQQRLTTTILVTQLDEEVVTN